MKRLAIVFRLLDRDKAVTVFEFLDPALQGELVTGLGEDDVLTVFAQLAPKDRAHLLDIMPDAVAGRLLAGLTADERRRTSIMLGHLGGSIGQWMTPDVLSVRPEQTVAAVWDLLRRLPLEEGASYTVPVTDDDGTLRGVVGLRELVTADPATTMGELSRLVRSRVVWLLVLAISAILTVQGLEIFEATLDRMVILALFIPLLTGTGGNTGNQAASTVTRALALGDVRIGDMGAALLWEVRVGAFLGVLLGALGCVLATVACGPAMGLGIGLTLLSVCTMAATRAARAPAARRPGPCAGAGCRRRAR